MVARSATAGFLLRHSFLILALILGCGAPGGATAEPAQNAMGFVDNVVSQAVATLRNQQLSEADRERKFHDLLDANFDIPRIARFVLGRYWNTTDAAEQRAFEELYERWTVRLYSARFKEYSGETIKVTGTRAESDTGSTVTSEIAQSDGTPPLKMEWRVRHDAGGFKIIDVTVEGVSLALTQREEFTAVIAHNGGTLDGLNKALQEKLAASEVAAGN